MKILNKYYFWIILLLILIAPFFVLSFFVFPSADDYSTFNLVNQHGYWAYQKYIYMNWTGRYAANIIEALNPLQCLFAYRIIPVLLLLLLFVSVFYFFRTFLKKYVNNAQIFLFSLIFFTLYLNTFPSTGEGIYWFPAGVEYLLASALTLFFVAVLYHLMNAQTKMRLLFWFVAAVLALFIIGLNEISLALVCGLTFFALTGSTYINHRIPVGLSLLFFITVVFAIVDIVAPGNFIRMSVFSGSMNFGHSMLNSGAALIKLLGIHFQNPPFVLLSFLVIPYIISIINKYNIRYRFLINPLLLVAFSLSLLFILYIPGFLSMGINPPMRVNALMSLIFMVLWFVNIVNLCHYIYRKKSMIPAFPDVLVKILLICTVILALSDFYKEPGKDYYFRSNIPRAYYDLFVKAVPYKQQMDLRNEMIKKAENSGLQEMKVEKLNAIPYTVFFVDIQSDTSYWINRDVSKYYGLTSISIEE